MKLLAFPNDTGCIKDKYSSMIKMLPNVATHEVLFLSGSIKLGNKTHSFVNKHANKYSWGTKQYFKGTKLILFFLKIFFLV